MFFTEMLECFTEKIKSNKITLKIKIRIAFCLANMFDNSACSSLGP